MPKAESIQVKRLQSNELYHENSTAQHQNLETVFSNNSISNRVLIKLGFSQEAILKEAIFKNGQWLDEHRFVLFKSQVPTLT